VIDYNNVPRVVSEKRPRFLGYTTWVLDFLCQDIWQAIRALRRDPAFLAVAALSLALGIGANTAIFTLIDAVMWKALPVSHPEELLEVTMGEHRGYFSNPVWEQLRDRQDVFSGIFAYSRWAFNLANGGEARNVNGSFVSGQYFDTLGLPAALGRTLTPADDRRGCDGAAVLSYGFWQREYGGRADVLGRSISVNTHPFEIVGVAARGFTGTEVGAAFDVMVPLCAEKIIHGDTQLLDASPAGGWLRVIGRPKPGIPATQAAARLMVLASEIFRSTVPTEWPAQDREEWLRVPLETYSAANGLSYLRQQYRTALLVLLSIAGVVLLIACVNVSNLLLARGETRHREFAIRAALGSGRGRLIRQLLTESLLLSTLGTVLGVLAAVWCTRLLVAFLDAPLDLKPDARVLAFTAGVAMATGLLFGISPAWHNSCASPLAAMKANAHVVIRGAGPGPGKLLLISQVALSMVLVSGGALLLSTFWRLATLDPGFDPGGVLLTSVDLRGAGYTPQRRAEVFQQILEALRALPGVRSASISDFTPILPARRVLEVSVEGLAARSREDSQVFANAVSDQYFATMKINLLAGRDFNSRDTLRSAAVAVVNQTMVRKYFGGADPVGAHFRVRHSDAWGAPIEIVGVAGDSKFNDLRQEIPPTVYTPWSQTEKLFPFTNVAVRTAGGAPTALIPGVKSAVASVDRAASIEFTTLVSQVDKSLQRERLLAMLASFFGGLALLLAAIGLYGVMSCNVARRRNEIGIRVALGAERGRVLRMVMADAAGVIAAGLGLGFCGTLAATRWIAGFLYGVQSNDPAMLLLSAATLAATAALAAYGPARRASRLDPMAALREE